MKTQTFIRTLLFLGLVFLFSSNTRSQSVKLKHVTALNGNEFPFELIINVEFGPPHFDITLFQQSLTRINRKPTFRMTALRDATISKIIIRSSTGNSRDIMHTLRSPKTLMPGSTYNFRLNMNKLAPGDYSFFIFNEEIGNTIVLFDAYEFTIE